MEKYSILLGYFDKQKKSLQRIYDEIISVDISIYDKHFLFALRTQQLYTGLEDLFKQIAKSFENHIDNMNNFHKELLVRMNTEIPKIRPAIIGNSSLILLDKLRAFRHFIRHAYDCELDEAELQIIQNKLINEYFYVEKDLENFRSYILKLANSSLS